MSHAILICIYVIEKCIPHSIVLLFTKKMKDLTTKIGNKLCHLGFGVRSLYARFRQLKL